MPALESFVVALPKMQSKAVHYIACFDLRGNIHLPHKKIEDSLINMYSGGSHKLFCFSAICFTLLSTIL